MSSITTFNNLFNLVVNTCDALFEHKKKQKKAYTQVRMNSYLFDEYITSITEQQKGHRYHGTCAHCTSRE